MEKKECVVKKFTKYFGGIYMKYWYVAAIVVTIVMIASLSNDKYIKGYKLYIYDEAGTQLSNYDIDSSKFTESMNAVKELKSGRAIEEWDDLSETLSRLPVTKKFVPQRVVNF